MNKVRRYGKKYGYKYAFWHDICLQNIVFNKLNIKKP